MGPIWGRQDPGGPHVGPMNFAIWEGMDERLYPIRYLAAITSLFLIVHADLFDI